MAAHNGGADLKLGEQLGEMCLFSDAPLEARRTRYI